LPKIRSAEITKELNIKNVSKLKIIVQYLSVRFFVLCSDENASGSDEVKLFVDDEVILHEEVQQLDRQVDGVGRQADARADLAHPLH
jgi:hypothetical protein